MLPSTNPASAMTNTFAADGCTRLFHAPGASAPPLVRAQDFNALQKRHVDLLRSIEGNAGFDAFWASLWAALGVVAGHEERERARTLYSASIAREIEPYRAVLHEALSLAQALSRAQLAGSPLGSVATPPTTSLDLFSPDPGTTSPMLVAARLRQLAAKVEAGVHLNACNLGDLPGPLAQPMPTEVRPALPATSLLDSRRTMLAELLAHWCAEKEVRLATCAGGRVTTSALLRSDILDLFRRSPTRSVAPRLTKPTERSTADQQDLLVVDSWATMHGLKFVSCTHGLITSVPVSEAALLSLLTTPALHKATSREPAERPPTANAADADDLLDVLLEARDEISRINRSSGTTTFNPAVTQLINQAITRLHREPADKSHPAAKTDDPLESVNRFSPRADENFREFQAGESAPAIVWPTSRDIGRSGDMAPRERTHLRLLLDSDNDLIVEVWEHRANDAYGRSASIEFCNGGGGGGSSSHTRAALLGVMVAMERDNAADPSRRWPTAEAPTHAAHESKASTVEGRQP